MSIRVDTVSLISGAIVCGNRGLGVVGSLIPASGDQGPGYTYNDLSLPADNAKEICGRITTWPTNGTLTAYEDTSFEYSGTTDTFQYQLYVDGVAVGSPATVTLQVGAATAQFAVTTDATVFSGAASVASASSQASFGAVGDDVVSSVNAVVRPIAVVGAVVDDAVFSGSALSGRSAAAISVTTESPLFVGTATSSHVPCQILASTEDALFYGWSVVAPHGRILTACEDTRSVFSAAGTASSVGKSIVLYGQITTEVVRSGRIATAIYLNPNSIEVVQMSTIYVGDVGTKIVIDCGIDISSATVMQIIVQKQDNGPKTVWTAQQENSTSIKYVTQDGDIDVSGLWKMQAYVEMPAWKGRGLAVDMLVLNKMQKPE